MQGRARSIRDFSERAGLHHEGGHAGRMDGYQGRRHSGFAQARVHVLVALQAQSMTYEKLVKEYPQAVGSRDDLAAICSRRRRMLQVKRPAAAQAGAGSLAAGHATCWRSLVRDQPADQDYQVRLVESLVNAAQAAKDRQGHRRGHGQPVNGRSRFASSWRPPSRRQSPGSTNWTTAKSELDKDQAGRSTTRRPTKPCRGQGRRRQPAEGCRVSRRRPHPPSRLRAAAGRNSTRACSRRGRIAAAEPAARQRRIAGQSHAPSARLARARRACPAARAGRHHAPLSGRGGARWRFARRWPPAKSTRWSAKTAPARAR